VFPSFAIKALLRENGEWWFICLVVIAFTSDTGAYFGGRFFGRKKLMPSVSPKKTIEGALSGGALAIAAAIAVVAFSMPAIPLWYIAVAALATTFAAQSGDLLESMIKRVAHVKDSGAIMPGHGGMLDRLDGVYFAAPVFYAFILWSRDLFPLA
jgi:phosphatidate cytidylyltransferase